MLEINKYINKGIPSTAELLLGIGTNPATEALALIHVYS